MKIAINGFGRLGRAIARVALERGVEIVGVNDIANAANLAYLLQYDSMHGTLCSAMKQETSEQGIDATNRVSFQQGLLHIPYAATTYRIPLFSYANSSQLDFGELGAEVVIESSGRFLRADEVSHHIEKGVKRVIISAPALDSTQTFVLGVNHTQYAGESIISNASCTTNCLAPIAMLLEREFGILRASLTTIHSYTNDQHLLDVAHISDKRRSRAAALNIIPTSTGAAKSLYKVLPSLRDKIHGHSVRVPVADVSMVDISAYVARDVSESELRELFVRESQGALRGILGVDDDYRVSSDFLGDSRSGIIASDLSFSLGKMCKVMAWYDNEWGYAHRILDMAEFILSR